MLTETKINLSTSDWQRLRHSVQMFLFWWVPRFNPTVLLHYCIFNHIINSLNSWLRWYIIISNTAQTSCMRKKIRKMFIFRNKVLLRKFSYSFLKWRHCMVKQHNSVACWSLYEICYIFAWNLNFCHSIQSENRKFVVANLQPPVDVLSSFQAYAPYIVPLAMRAGNVFPIPGNVILVKWTRDRCARRRRVEEGSNTIILWLEVELLNIEQQNSNCLDPIEGTSFRNSVNCFNDSTPWNEIEIDWPLPTIRFREFQKSVVVLRRKAFSLFSLTSSTFYRIFRLFGHYCNHLSSASFTCLPKFEFDCNVECSDFAEKFIPLYELGMTRIWISITLMKTSLWNSLRGRYVKWTSISIDHFANGICNCVCVFWDSVKQNTPLKVLDFNILIQWECVPALVTQNEFIRTLQQIAENTLLDIRMSPASSSL